MEDFSIHKGHRERLMAKVCKSPEVLSEHELLEAILFMIIPRVDTNPIAHNLIRMFGSLGQVFEATPEELCTVKGVGMKIAKKIYLIGKTYERIGMEKRPKKKINSISAVKEHVLDEFKNLKKERCVLYLLNAQFRILHSFAYENNEYGRVEAEPKEVIRMIGAHKPKFLLIAHNHPSGSLLPSVNDDFSTANLIKLCELLDVEVVDHIIITGDEYYSYSSSGHLDEIKRNPSFYKMLATGKGY